jgi:hypothetical protein
LVYSLENQGKYFYFLIIYFIMSEVIDTNVALIKGSCCCGAIQFELSETPSMMGTCHCSRCRKVGASTFVFVKKESFHWIQGQESVSRYEPEAPYKYTRCFCKKCGTALGEISAEQGSFPIPANTLDSDPIVRNYFHEFVSEKPDWYSICDTAKQFEGHPTQS